MKYQIHIWIAFLQISFVMLWHKEYLCSLSSSKVYDFVKDDAI